MELLCEAGLVRGSSSLHLPSWVVDWSNNARLPNYNFTRPSFGTCLDGLARNPQAVVKLTDDPLIISAKGSILDTIVSVSPPCH